MSRLQHDARNSMKLFEKPFPRQAHNSALVRRNKTLTPFSDIYFTVLMGGMPHVD